MGKLTPMVEYMEKTHNLHARIMSQIALGHILWNNFTGNLNYTLSSPYFNKADASTLMNTIIYNNNVLEANVNDVFVSIPVYENLNYRIQDVINEWQNSDMCSILNGVLL